VPMGEIIILRWSGHSGSEDESKINRPRGQRRSQSASTENQQDKEIAIVNWQRSRLSDERQEKRCWVVVGSV
jgi:hypothetical protein